MGSGVANFFNATESLVRGSWILQAVLADQETLRRTSAAEPLAD